MAGARCATSALAATTTETQKPLNISSTSVSSVKPSRRRNSLRMKILKTLAKPIPSTYLPLPVNPDFAILSPEIPPLSDSQLETPSGTGEITETLEMQVDAPGEHGGGDVGWSSTRSVFNVCLCLIGAILIHIFHGVWFLRKTVSEGQQKNGHQKKLEIPILETNTGGKSLFNGNELEENSADIVSRGGSSGSLDESKLKAKIHEIRRMAKEVRRGKGTHVDIEKDRTETEKQISWGLSRVQRKIGYLSIKSHSLVKVEDGKIPSDVDLKELSKKLIFKKSDLDASVVSVCNDDVELLDGDKQVNLQDDELLPSVYRSSVVKDGNNSDKSKSNSIPGIESGSN